MDTPTVAKAPAPDWLNLANGFFIFFWVTVASSLLFWFPAMSFYTWYAIPEGQHCGEFTPGIVWFVWLVTISPVVGALFAIITARLLKQCSRLVHSILLVILAAPPLLGWAWSIYEHFRRSTF